MAYDTKGDTSVRCSFPDSQPEGGSQKVCAWPACDCEVGRMCQGAVTLAFSGLRERQAKLEAVIADMQETLNARMPRGRL